MGKKNSDSKKTGKKNSYSTNVDTSADSRREKKLEAIIFGLSPNLFVWLVQLWVPSTTIPHKTLITLVAILIFSASVIYMIYIRQRSRSQVTIISKIGLCLMYVVVAALALAVLWLFIETVQWTCPQAQRFMGSPSATPYTISILLSSAAWISVSEAVVVVFLVMVSLKKSKEGIERPHLKYGVIAASISIVFSCISVLLLLSYDPTIPSNLELYSVIPRDNPNYEMISEIDYKEVTASNPIPYKVNGLTYGPGNVIIDKKNKYPWIEKHESGAIVRGSAFIELLLNDEETIQSIGLWPGFRGHTDKARPSKVRFEFSTGETVEYTFKDMDEIQYVILNKSVTTNSVKITILDTYDHGSEEICIQKVELFRLNEKSA